MLSIIQQKFEEEKDTLKNVFLSVFIFGLIAHAYAFFNPIHTFDSLTALTSNFASGQIPLKIGMGRVAQPLYFLFRGDLAAPWLLGFLALFWLALSCYLLIKTFQINSRWMQCVLCGIFATHFSLTLTIATCCHEMDTYMLALLFACMSVYVFEKYKYGWIFTPLFAYISLLFYPAYFAVAVSSFVLLIIRDILNNKDFASMLAISIKAVSGLLIGIVGLYITMALVKNFTNYGVMSSYPNHIDQANVDIFNYPQVAMASYLDYFKNTLSTPTYFIKATGLFNIAFYILSSVFALIICIKKKVTIQNIALLILLLIILPFAFNLLYFITQGLNHDLMKFAYVSLYLLPLIITIEWSKLSTQNETKPLTWPNFSLYLSYLFLIFSNCIYSNQAYMGMHFVHQRNLADVNRILYTIEQTDGYEYNQTPVILLGDFGYTSNIQTTRAGFEHLTGYCMKLGSGLQFQKYDNRALKVLLTSYLAYPINIKKITKEIRNEMREEVAEMPAFPRKGYCKMINGTLVIKLPTDNDL